ncbi:bifunctional 2-polyprenyl-6-hydroxyphenol methylase/3-demethylubiquinol 3-O-methyltransferase UbiG [Streptomyces sp. PT12]|uniref:class I SAM-dependent methyltransferase n=1 Tax=Streptomyces sp. PT12 TaxID=1510197 RepID=UPI000DE48301|nr:class I SAM-dependent methyltransferase [Streptomyces sp. PT12]RBM18577.1 hypothetical protein DEH69_12915 [Streptomyces sp. PT12]
MTAHGTTPVPTDALAERSRTVGALFDDVAEALTRLGDWMSEAPGLREWLDARLPGGARAIDVGCGTGRFCPRLAERYEEVVGVDPAGALLDIGRKTNAGPGIRYERRSAYDVTPERDGRFDLVFSYSAVFHMRPYEAILPHLISLVAPGGRMVIFEPERTALHDRKGKDADWLVNVAFQSAQLAYRMAGDVGAAIDALRLFFHPSWQKLSEGSALPSREEFGEVFSTWLPGSELAHDVVPGMAVAVWEAPAD